MKKLLATILILLSTLTYSFAAIAFDNSTRSTDSTWGTGSTASWSHKVSGSNTLLIVCTFNNGNTGAPLSVLDGATAMTKLQDQATDGGGFHWTLWYLINPPTGTSTILVTWLTGDGINNNIAVSYTGVNQGSFPDSSNTGSTGSAASISVSTTVVESNSWLAGCTRSSNVTQSGGTNATVRQAGNTNASQVFHDSNGTVSTGSQTATINVSPNNTQWMNLVSIAPATSAASTPSTLGFFKYYNKRR